MRGRDFLPVAGHLVQQGTEAALRTGFVNAYYALFLECRDILARWGVPPPPKHNVHTPVRLTFTYAGDPQLKAIADLLDRFGRRRNQASYDLSPRSMFTDPSVLRTSIAEADDAIALLDAIDGDPVRRTAAIASLPP